MRCLIYAKSSDTQWVKDSFPGLEPYLLKIVNKPLLEYYLDLASLMKIHQVRIASDTSVKEIEKYFGTGSKWGVDISYTLSRPEDNLKSVYLKNLSFCKDTDLIILNGFFFVEYDRNRDACSEVFKNRDSCIELGKRLIFIPQGAALSDMHSDDLDGLLVPREFQDNVSYYKLSMDILINNNKKYVLPGYSNEENAFYGFNFIFPHSCSINKPIMIGSNSRFLEHTTIGPNTIIGDNVIIDQNTDVSDSIILDNTYVGADLEIKQKIFYHNQIISGLSGERIQIQDNMIISQVEQGIMASFFNIFVQRMFSLVMILVQLVPWIILGLPYSLLFRSKRVLYLLDKRGTTIRLLCPEKMRDHLFGRFLLRFCLDKFEGLFLSVIGKLYLVGNHLFPDSAPNRKLTRDLSAYKPGIFSLVDSIVGVEKGYDEFYELEYINNCSTRDNIKILFKSIYNRLIHGK